MAKTRQSTIQTREAARIQALIDRGAYDLLTYGLLEQECQRRMLPTGERKHNVVARLKRDDRLEAIHGPNAYASLVFARSMKPPPYITWDRTIQNTQTQQAGNYTSRLEASAKAAEHSPSLRISFLSLPPELRNTVYCTLFTAAPGIVRNHRVHPFVLDHGNQYFFGHEQALIRTCKAIHSDALPIWYANRDYYFTQARSYLQTNYNRLTFPYRVDW